VALVVLFEEGRKAQRFQFLGLDTFAAASGFESRLFFWALRVAGEHRISPVVFPMHPSPGASVKNSVFLRTRLPGHSLSSVNTSSAVAVGCALAGFRACRIAGRR
jgi:hypothetical protein